MTAFDEFTFFLDVLERQRARLGKPPVSPAAREGYSGFFHDGVLDDIEPVFPRASYRREDECLMIAHMALDTRRMIVAAAADDSATVEHDDLIALGWTQEQVRRFGAVALAAALASVKAEADLAHQRQFSGFAASATSAVLVACCFTIGLACVGVASLL